MKRMKTVCSVLLVGLSLPGLALENAYATPVEEWREDVYDDSRERFLHSSPDVSYYQLHVPLLIWGDKRWRDAHPQLFAQGRSNSREAVSSNSVFHTLLELAGIRTRYRRDDLSVVSSRFKGGVRFYLNDRYECVPIEALELPEEDIRLFRAKGLHLGPLPNE